MSKKVKKVVIAPDKFKGTLSAKTVCKAIDAGLKKFDPQIETIHHPLADGGDGSLEILSKHLQIKGVKCPSQDPLGRPITCEYFVSDTTAFIEIASASGLVLLSESERNAATTSTYGTGLLIKDAIEKGKREIVLFLGGSATNDAGIGIAQALGFRFFDQNNEVLDPTGENLIRIQKIQKSTIDILNDIEFTLLVDVKNPLYGPNGAAYVYAQQKGADQEGIKRLDDGLRSFATILKNQTGKDISNLPGGGAAGGIAAGLVAMLNAQIKTGIDSIIELTNFEKELKDADLVISGEGRLDSQSLQGKVVKGVSELCKKHHKNLALFVGISSIDQQSAHDLSPYPVNQIMNLAKNQKDAFENGNKYLEELAFLFAKKYF